MEIKKYPTTFTKRTIYLAAKNQKNHFNYSFRPALKVKHSDSRVPYGELSGTFGEHRWTVLEEINGVKSGMFLIFDDYSRAALAPLARINYKLTPN